MSGSDIIKSRNRVVDVGATVKSPVADVAQQALECQMSRHFDKGKAVGVGIGILVGASLAYLGYRALGAKYGCH